jgi:hypothetical protein
MKASFGKFSICQHDKSVATGTRQSFVDAGRRCDFHHFK